MKNMIKLDFYKMLCNKRFYIAVFGIGVLMFWNIFPAITVTERPTLEDSMILSLGNGLVLLSFVLCVIGSGLQLCMERKHGCIRYFAIRTEKRKYVLAQTVVAAISGYCSVAGGLLLCILMEAIILSIKYHSISKVVADSSQFIAIIWFILIMSYIGAVLSVLATMLSCWTKNLYVVTVMPIVLYYMIVCITPKSIPPFLNFTYIFFCYAPIFSTYWIQFFYALLITILMDWIMYKIIILQLDRRIQNE